VLDRNAAHTRQVADSFPLEMDHHTHKNHYTVSRRLCHELPGAAEPGSDLQASQSSVHQMIESRLMKADIRSRTTLTQILEWTLHSRRLLKPCELLEALSTKTELDRHGFTRLLSGDALKLNNEEDLMNLCKGILIVTEHNMLSFADDGIASYLSTTGAEILGLRPAGKVHETIAAVCLQHALHLDPQAFLTPWISRRKVIREEFNHYHFSEYATLYWLEHFHLAGQRSRILPFLLHRAIENVVQREDVASSDLSGPQLWQRKIDIGLRVCCLFDAEVLGRTYIDQGASFFTKSLGTGETMLHVAAMNQSLEVTRLLIEKGADVEGRVRVDGALTPCTSQTPLHVAAIRGNLSVVKLLVSAGASVNAKTMTTGRTALQLAVELGHDEIVNYLLESGASSTQIGRPGRLARLAQNCGHYEMKKLLSGRSRSEAEYVTETSTHWSPEEQEDLEDSCAQLRELSFHEDQVTDEDDGLLQCYKTDVVSSSQRSSLHKDSDGSVSLNCDSWQCIELADCDAEIFSEVIGRRYLGLHLPLCRVYPSKGRGL
jgi:ankyrin repeat protein